MEGSDKPCCDSLKDELSLRNRIWSIYPSASAVRASILGQDRSGRVELIVGFPGCYVFQIHSLHAVLQLTSMYQWSVYDLPITDHDGDKNGHILPHSYCLDLRPPERRLVRPSNRSISTLFGGSITPDAAYQADLTMVMQAQAAYLAANAVSQQSLRAMPGQGPMVPPQNNPPLLGRTPAVAQFYAALQPPDPADQYGALSEKQYRTLRPDQKAAYQAARRIDITAAHDPRQVLPFGGMIKWKEYNDMIRQRNHYKDAPGEMQTCEDIMPCRSLGGFEHPVPKPKKTDTFTTWVPWLAHHTVNNIFQEAYRRYPPKNRGQAGHNLSAHRGPRYLLKPAKPKPYLNKYGRVILDIPILPDELKQVPPTHELLLYKYFDDRVTSERINERLPNPLPVYPDKNGQMKLGESKRNAFRETLARFCREMNFQPWALRGNDSRIDRAISGILEDNHYDPKSEDVRGIATGQINDTLPEAPSNRILIKDTLVVKLKWAQSTRLNSSLLPGGRIPIPNQDHLGNELKGFTLGDLEKGFDIAKYSIVLGIAHDRKEGKRQLPYERSDRPSKRQKFEDDDQHSNADDHQDVCNDKNEVTSDVGATDNADFQDDNALGHKTNSGLSAFAVYSSTYAASQDSNQLPPSNFGGNLMPYSTFSRSPPHQEPAQDTHDPYAGRHRNLPFAAQSAAADAQGKHDRQPAPSDRMPFSGGRQSALNDVGNSDGNTKPYDGQWVQNHIVSTLMPFSGGTQSGLNDVGNFDGSTDLSNDQWLQKHDILSSVAPPVAGTKRTLDASDDDIDSRGTRHGEEITNTRPIKRLRTGKTRVSQAARNVYVEEQASQNEPVAPQMQPVLEQPIPVPWNSGVFVPDHNNGNDGTSVEQSGGNNLLLPDFSQADFDHMIENWTDENVQFAQSSISNAASAPAQLVRQLESDAQASARRKQEEGRMISEFFDIEQATSDETWLNNLQAPDVPQLPDITQTPGLITPDPNHIGPVENFNALDMTQTPDSITPDPNHIGPVEAFDVLDMTQTPDLNMPDFFLTEASVDFV